MPTIVLSSIRSISPNCVLVFPFVTPDLIRGPLAVCERSCAGPFHWILGSSPKDDEKQKQPAAFFSLSFLVMARLDRAIFRHRRAEPNACAHPPEMA
jgi:hypothetical protein